MFRLTTIFLLLAVFLFSTNCEVPRKHLTFQLGENDVVSGDESFKTRINDQEVGFIGDLIIGKRHADETVYRRSIQVTNHDPFVSFYSVEFAVKSGAIHYLSIRNNRNSYAVACDGPYKLGTPVTRFNVRVLPRTESFISIELATHPE